MNLRNRKNLSNDEPKQIFYVWNYLEWGGVQTYFLGLMRGVSRKYSVKTVLPFGSDKKILAYLKANNVEYDFFEGKLDSSPAVTLIKKIKRRYNDFKTNFLLARHLSKYDLTDSAVQIDAVPWMSFALLFYLATKTQVFVTLHTALPEISFLRRMWWKTKLAILNRFESFHLNASNLDVKKSLRSLVNESRCRQIEIIYSSFNRREIEEITSSKANKREVFEKYNLPESKIRVCNVGQFIERKGCWVLMEAIEILQKQRDDIFFLWLGTSPLDKQTVEKIETYHLNGSFRFLSANEIGTRRADLLTLWNAADIFVLPSFEEGLPMALIEAMALGKPCIASNINAIPEAVKHLETGILLKPGNAAELARAIESLAEDSGLRVKLGENARKSVFENFEEKITGQKMLRLYDASLRRKSGNN